jgi:hypothetical protein
LITNAWVTKQVSYELPSRVGKAGLPKIIPVSEDYSC